MLKRAYILEPWKKAYLLSLSPMIFPTCSNAHDSAMINLVFYNVDFCCRFLKAYSYFN